ncbi:MAG: PocR ligand-binding domain-containing protein [Acholeplasmataceae bacterium]|nr:PocR ligand-binding domain-containing protein [Acholeplasmataceae bacterium]
MKKDILKYIDFNRFNILLEGFNKSTGFVTAILDIEGNIISKSGWRHICTDFHRVNTETSKNCKISDTVLANDVSRDKKYSIYKCHNGLIDIAVPIIIQGEHIANLFTGQCFLEKPNINFFVDQAKKYGFDEKAYLKSLKEVPIVTEKQIEDIIDFLLNLTQMIVDLTIDRIEKENSELLLKSSLESPTDFIILAIDKNYNYLYFNKVHKDVMKFAYNADIKTGSNLMDAISSNVDKENAKRNYDLALSGKSHKTIQEYGDVNIRYYESIYNPIYNDKQEIIGASAFARDITDRIESEHEINYRKELLQYIIGRSNQGIAVHDKDLNYVYVSDRYCEIYNVSKDIVGKHHYEVFPDLPQKWRDVHQRSLKGETVSGDRDDFIRLDGSVQYTRWLSQPWYDVNGEIAGIIIYTEVINDLIETELQLNETLDRLKLVMDNLIIGIAVNSVDPEVNFEYMNSNFPIFYGTTREALMKPDSFWDVVYEDETFRKEIKEKVLMGLASNDPKLKRWEYVPITKNGKIVRYITAQGVNVPNSPLIISMVMDVTEQKHKEEDILYTSNHDYLTGLPNRKYFEEKLLELDHEEYYPLTVAMIDLDGLKLINDAYGHDLGDTVLIKVSNILTKHIRKDDFVARIGGDEFVMICPNTNEKEFEIIRNSISSGNLSFEYHDFKFSISIGHDVKINSSINIKDVLKNAEDRMYANKILHGQSARNETIMTLFETLKEKYEEEKLHSSRVSDYCKMMGEKLYLSEDQTKELEFAGLMHDIGKITIPDRILDKPGKLTDEEWVIMKTHTINGYHILRSADKYSKLAEYALTHHERWDGKGYPNGLKEEEIPLFSRVICICDAYEAMTADRPYRKALDYKVAISELNRCAGSQFDKELVGIFIKAITEKEYMTS